MSLTSEPLPKTIFASSNLGEHLARGVVGICALNYAIAISVQHPVYSLALGIVSLLAFRGCPTCWTIGLLETTYRQFKRHNSAGK